MADGRVGRRSVGNGGTRRVAGALAVLLVAVGAVLVGSAAPAAAHASLVDSVPADRQVLPAAPSEIMLTFSEKVTPSDDSIKVLDGHGEVVAKGAQRVEGKDHALRLRLGDELEDGAYVATWRVISADSHPAAGAFTFRVGEGDQDFHLGDDLLEPEGGDRTVGILFGAARFGVFGSLIVLLGGLAFVSFLWPGGLARSRARRVLVGSLLAAAVLSVVAALLQGPYGEGTSLAGTFDPSTMARVLESTYGRSVLARLALLLAVGVVLRGLLKRGTMSHVAGTVGAGTKVAVAVLGTATLATLSSAGHAAAGRLVPLAFVTDVLHLVAISLWLGGLVLLTILLREREPGARMVAVVDGFSRVAFLSVIVMVVTGTVQSWRQVEELGNLTGTTFGRLLLVKVGLVALMVALGGLSRRALRVRPDPVAVGDGDAAPGTDEAEREVPLPVGPGAALADPEADLVRRLRRSVRGEVAVAVAVLAVTAVLVNSVPGRATAASEVVAIPFSTEIVQDGLKVGVSVEPARVGNNDVHVYVFGADDAAVEPLDVRATLTLASGAVSPIKVDLVKTGLGHYSAFGFPVPIAGAWRLDVAVAVSEFDTVRVSADVPVR